MVQCEQLVVHLIIKIFYCMSHLIIQIYYWHVTVLMLCMPQLCVLPPVCHKSCSIKTAEQIEMIVV